MDPMLLCVIGALAAIGITIAFFAHRAKLQREEALFELATDWALRFEIEPGDIHERFASFEPFDKGNRRSSANLLAGRMRNFEWQFFDYEYHTGSGKSDRTHRWGIASVQLPIVAPMLTIRPEGWFDKIAAFAGSDEINFESEAFSRAYFVKCDDRKFAYDLIHPQLIEYLMSLPRRHWQLRGRDMLVIRDGRYSADDLRQLVQEMEGFIKRIPDYVRTDRVARPV